MVFANYIQMSIPTLETWNSHTQVKPECHSFSVVFNLVVKTTVNFNGLSNHTFLIGNTTRIHYTKNDFMVVVLPIDWVLLRNYFRLSYALNELTRTKQNGDKDSSYVSNLSRYLPTFHLFVLPLTIFYIELVSSSHVRSIWSRWRFYYQKAISVKVVAAVKMPKTPSYLSRIESNYSPKNCSKCTESPILSGF